MRGARGGGGAYVMGKGAQRGKQREAEEEGRMAGLGAQRAPPATTAAQAPASPSGVGGSDLVDKLKELKGLADAGALSPEEFEAAKRKLLDG